MIDLRNKELPSRLVWEGGSCEILTDFRIWITFGQFLRDKPQKIWFGIFPSQKPPKTDAWIHPAIEFLQSPNIVPRATRTPTNIKALDLIVDGEFIVSSFQQAYGIDLTNTDYMHWHRFKALLEGLPDNTRMSKIMGYRTWTPADEKREHKDFMAEQRAAWALPIDDVDEDDNMGGFGALIKAVNGL